MAGQGFPSSTETFVNESGFEPQIGKFQSVIVVMRRHNRFGWQGFATEDSFQCGRYIGRKTERVWIKFSDGKRMRFEVHHLRVVSL